MDLNYIDFLREIGPMLLRQPDADGREVATSREWKKGAYASWNSTTCSAELRFL